MRKDKETGKIGYPSDYRLLMARWMGNKFIYDHDPKQAKKESFCWLETVHKINGQKH